MIVTKNPISFSHFSSLFSHSLIHCLLYTIASLSFCSFFSLGLLPLHCLPRCDYLYFFFFFMLSFFLFLYFFSAFRCPIYTAKEQQLRGILFILPVSPLTLGHSFKFRIEWDRIHFLLYFLFGCFFLSHSVTHSPSFFQVNARCTICFFFSHRILFL